MKKFMRSRKFLMGASLAGLATLGVIGSVALDLHAIGQVAVGPDPEKVGNVDEQCAHVTICSRLGREVPAEDARRRGQAALSARVRK